MKIFLQHGIEKLIFLWLLMLNFQDSFIYSHNKPEFKLGCLVASFSKWHHFIKSHRAGDSAMPPW